MNRQLAIVLEALRQAFTTPMANPTRSAVIVGFLLLLGLFVVFALALVFTPKRRKVVKRRRYRKVARTTDESTPAEQPGAAAARIAAAAETSARAEATAAQAAAKAEERADSRARRARAVRRGLPIAVPLLLIAAVFSGYAVTGSDWYCVSFCHQTQTVVHAAKVTRHAHCTQCHELPGVSAIPANLSQRGVMLGAALAGKHPGGPTVVSSEGCLKCHRKVLTGTSTDSARGIRMSHKETAEAGMTCTYCHTATGHSARRTYSMSTCTPCHGGKPASAQCSTCHTKDPSIVAVSGSKESSATMGSGAVVYPAVAVGDLGCGGCHDQTKQCDTCHGLRMPHSPEFVAGGHAREAAWEGKQKCLKCHTAEWCSTGCHSPFASGHPGDWKHDHQSMPWTSGCGCHAQRSGRTTPMCNLCHTPPASAGTTGAGRGGSSLSATGTPVGLP